MPGASADEPANAHVEVTVDDPDAVLTVDGAPLPHPGSALVQLSAGHHLLEVRGHGRVCRRVVTIADGERLRLHADLPRRRLVVR